MSQTAPSVTDPTPRTTAGSLAGVACISAALLMTELALTRIFSVTMYYHFAFLAISIALFGLGASGVYVYLARGPLGRVAPARLLAWHALAYALVTTVSLALLVRLRVGLNYSLENLLLMLAIYALAALPFFTGGAVISLAISRLAGRINLVYAADLLGASAGCLLLLPLLDRVGAPGVVLATAALGAIAACCVRAGRRARPRGAAGRSAGRSRRGPRTRRASCPSTSRTPRATRATRCCSASGTRSRASAVYDRRHGDWSLSATYTGPMPDSRFMDIDSAASTPIIRFSGDLASVAYLKSELTALGYHLAEPGFTALVIGPGGGRDLLSALVFGARRVDGVEINPIIANDVMRDRFRDYSGRLYTRPDVRIAVEDGRSFVRRSPERYDVIQASLVDTWAATAAGAYTLTENSLYTVEAFEDYLDHLSDRGFLTITRWALDGVRLVSLAQEACARRGWNAADRLAVVQHEKVATFILKKSPFTAAEVQRLQKVCDDLQFTVLYAPGHARRRSAWRRPAPGTGKRPRTRRTTTRASSSRPTARRSTRATRSTSRPTTDDRPFFFHTTKLKDQVGVAFGRTMLFGNGLSALMTLMAISTALVLLFILGPMALSGRSLLGTEWPWWLAYFGLLGAAFMLVEVALLQRFVLLLGHPVYSLTVTLFSLLLGTGTGSFLSRRIDESRVRSAAGRRAVRRHAAGVSRPTSGFRPPFARRSARRSARGSPSPWRCCSRPAS